jgi:hypothetical protein
MISTIICVQILQTKLYNAYTVHLLCPSPVISVVLSCASNPNGLFLQLFTYYKKNGISKSATFNASRFCDFFDNINALNLLKLIASLKIWSAHS